MVVGFVSIHVSFKKFILISISDFKDSFRYPTSSPPNSTKESSANTGTLSILTTLNGYELLKRKESGRQRSRHWISSSNHFLIPNGRD